MAMMHGFDATLNHYRKPLFKLYGNDWLHYSSKMNFSLKVGMVDVHIQVSSHLKEDLAWAANKQLWVISIL